MRTAWLVLWATVFVVVAPLWPDRDAGTATDSPGVRNRLSSAFGFAAVFVYLHLLVGLPVRELLTDPFDPCFGVQSRTRPRMCRPEEYYLEQIFGYLDLVLAVAATIWIVRLGWAYCAVAVEFAHTRRLHVSHWRWLGIRSAFDGACYWGFLICATMSTVIVLAAIGVAEREGLDSLTPALALFWEHLSRSAWTLAGFAGPAILIAVVVRPCQRTIDRLAKPSWMATVFERFE